MWLTVPEAEIVAIADASEKGLAAEKTKLKIDNGFADYRKMLAEVKPDIVSIGPRYVGEHRDMVMASIDAGARGIYMEKPFVPDLVQADEIVAACKAKDVKLALAHRNRYLPVLPTLKKLLDDGAIGKVLEIRGRGKEDPRGGALDFWVLGSHLLNLYPYFTGKAIACTGELLQDGKPVTRADLKEGGEGVGLIGGNELHVRYETASGIPAYFDSIANVGKKPGGFGMLILGSKGAISLRMDSNPSAHLIAGNPFEPPKEPSKWVPISSVGPGESEPIPNIDRQASSHYFGATDLIASIRENRQPLCNVDEGLAIIEMIFGVFESHRLNGQRVVFPLQTRKNPLGLMT